MARQVQRFDSVNVSGAAQAHLGDTIINHYHTVIQPQENLLKALLESLTFDGMGARVRNVAAALPRTCEWLPFHQHFIAWTDDRKMQEHHGFLWLKGKPGSGKSTIMKETFAWAKRAWSDQILLSYFFNARSPYVLDKSSLGLYRSLVWQLQAVVPMCHSLFLEHFAPKGREKKEVNGQKTIEVEEWTEIELQNFLIAIIRKFPLPPITIFIDALDEGADDDIRQMVRFLERMTQYAVATAAICRVRICLSSRHYPHITVTKSLSITVEEQAQHSQDVELYIRSELVGSDIRGIDDLRRKIRERSQGIFLWVVLVVPILNEAYDQGRSVSTMLRRLNETPQGLRDLFNQIFTRNTDDLDQCVTLLQWVMFAKRPLSPIELYHTINQVDLKDDDEEPVIVTYNQAIRYLRNLSRGLVEPIKKSWTGDSTVQFIHETVRDYLTSEHLLERRGSQGPTLGISTQDFQADICHEKLAEACLLYILHSHHKEPSPRTVEKVYPLVRYAAEYWWQHFQASPSPCSARVVQQALKLLTGSTDSLFLWIRLYNIGSTDKFIDKSIYESIDKFTVLTTHDLASPLYYAACVGRSELVSGVLALGADVNAQGGERYETALHAASARGHEGVVRTLIDAGADLNTGLIYRRTALCAASHRGYEGVVQILIDAGANVNAQGGEDGDTALHAASAHGREKVVQILVDAGADPDVRGGKDFGTALYMASEAGYERVVQILIDAGADLNTGGGKFSDTPLYVASAHGREKVVQILVDAGADTNIQGAGGYYGTALGVASQAGYEKVVQILSKCTIDFK